MSPSAIKYFTLASFAKVTPTRFPFKLNIGPPLFPGFIGASIWISFELSSNPLSALTIPEEILRSSLNPFPKGKPAT